MKELDVFLTKVLSDKYADLDDTFERRDYFELEKENPDFLKGTSDSYGISYLIDVGDVIHIKVNLYKDLSVSLETVYDNSDIIRKTIFTNIETHINEFIRLNDIFISLERQVDSFITEDKNYMRRLKIDQIQG
jgi:hypothetical protein